MPISILPEPEPQPPFENCCFCRAPTKFWTELEDRTGGAQVACCRSCAEQHEPSEVPTKLDWFKKEKALREAREGYTPASKSRG